MKNNKILSIIVPSYNTSVFVDECVPTFINKKLFDLVDIYFIDDGATDNTKEKLETYINRFPDYFHFYHKNNGGHGSVINFGLKNCVKTKYFKVIDGDDYVDSEALYKLALYLSTCDDDLVVSGYCEKYTNKIIEIKPLNQEQEIKYQEKTSYGLDILLNMNITIHSCTFKTCIFVDHKIILPEKVFFEDNLFIIYPVPFLKSVSFVNDYIYFYRLGNPNQSVSYKGRTKHYDDSIFVRKLAFSYFENNIQFFSDTEKKFFFKHISQTLSCYRNTILYYKNNKIARKKCLEIYQNDLKYPDLMSELKKSRFYKWLFNTHFNFIGIFRRIQIRELKKNEDK
ncbi:MAG TPA: hypothetical protein DDW20_03210 [Firmicutes bacterium]|nr:hypothetical protein [Bacillota bacterium]